jgi:acyl carrier protein
VLTSVLPIDAARAGWQVDVASLTSSTSGDVIGARPSAEAGLEETLAHIWADTLGHPVVGLDQDFIELGGDSLTAIRLLTRIREATDVKLSRSSLFEASTVRQLAATISEMRSRGETGGDGAAASVEQAAIPRLSRPRT